MGYLERDNRISRSIRMIKPYREEGGPRPVLSYSKQDVLRFQILGRIVASAPIPVPESDRRFLFMEATISCLLFFNLFPDRQQRAQEPT